MKFEWLLLAAAAGLGFLPVPGIAGEVLTYPWLGVLPGLALTSWLLARDPASVRWTVAVAIAPLVASLAGWLLVSGGVGFAAAARATAIASGLVAAAGLARARPAGSGAGVPRAVLLWSLGLGLLLFAIPCLNPYLFIRGDSWVHGGIVMELLERGFPPEDARMAGLRLNYVWFFNLFIALLAGLRDQDPFPFMALFNAANGFATVALAGLAAYRLWNSTRAAFAAAAMLTLGLNAGAFLLWPLRLVLALRGEVRGWDEVLLQIRTLKLGTARVIYDLHAPFTEMVSFLDKLLVGTALNYAYLMLVLMLWALLLALGDRRRAAWPLLLLSAAGMMLFHSVVGLSVLPVTIAALALAALVRARAPWLPAPGRLAAAGAALAAGAIATLPYMRSITSGWSPEKAGFQHRYLQFNDNMPWTLATSCFFACVALRAPLRAAWREHRPLPIVLAVAAAGLAAFACIVHLPYGNSVKFVFEFFTLAVVLSAPGVASMAEGLWRRRRGAALALASLFVIPFALTVHGYLADPTGRTRAELHPRPGENEVYRWLRHQTPVDAVLVDRDFRDLIAVRARRRLFLGTEHRPELAAFPAPELYRRRRVMADLYGGLLTPDSTVAGLKSLGRSIYVLYRPEDPAPVPEPWARLVDAAAGSSVVYDRDGYHVVRLARENGS